MHGAMFVAQARHQVGKAPHVTEAAAAAKQAILRSPNDKPRRALTAVEE